MFATKGVGLPLDNLDYHIKKDGLDRYSLSKFAKRHKIDGVISIPLNPGNLSSDLYREAAGAFKVLVDMVSYPQEYGACTELFAGFSPEIMIENSGSWVIPFGRLMPIRKDLE
ncbi:hypothetical protein B0T17DRAFT_613528 [Bombardia bombarda]|uniref:Uncharacterized protein n=1 Tax=Bombardia bombarda TaxID=252184 RepID=A0AA39XMN5_9PEZI|nr:hypothetical protein B0T17DRAFT_613528 [Bombardia bombarda]